MRAFLGRDPRPLYNGRRVADVLVVSALKLGNPMVLGVETVTDNLSLHAGRESLHRRRGAMAAPVR